MTQILDEVRPKAKADGVEDTRDALSQYFISKVREKIHIILAFSPVGTTFR